ncbi:MAG TPA: DMT family transporter [Gammaproteobacteria bacterium]
MSKNLRVVLLFAAVILIWSTTWYGIKLQTNGTPPAISVGLRFTLASLLLFAWLLATRQHRIQWKALGLVLLQGLAFFGVTYVLEYTAMQYLTSGLAALLFSTTILFNLLNEALWLRRSPAPATLLAAMMGVGGLALIFGREWHAQADFDSLLVGSALMFTAAFVASLGNVLGSRLLSSGTSIVTLNTYAMMAGAVFSLTWGGMVDGWSTFDPSAVWIGATVYLAIIGSVVAFGLYFTLLREVGASRAAYATVAVPAFALLISTALENYQWTMMNAAGLALVILGNALILRVREIKAPA